MIQYKSSGDGRCNKCPISQIGYHCNELCGNERWGKELASALKWSKSNSNNIGPWIFKNFHEGQVEGDKLAAKDW
jgi:hypothetical protein